MDRQPHWTERAETAHRPLGHTLIAPWTARLLVGLFLASLVCVPLLQFAGGPAWSGLDWRRASPQVSWPARLLETDRALLRALDQYDERLADESVLGNLARPPLQYLLTRWLGAGNEQVYCGRDGWLFYRPDIDYLTGPGFLEAGQLARRRASGPAWTTPPQPDPRLAVLDVERQLGRRDIELILVPVPVKPAVHPEYFAAAHRLEPRTLANPSYASFVRQMQRRGILVFDGLRQTLAAAKAQEPQFLRTDTHWRPQAVQRAARDLAAFIEDRVYLPPVKSAYAQEDTAATHRGDTAQMLDLPAGQGLYGVEQVPLAQVRTGQGGLWRADPQADILVLGDSFSNIYSQRSMGWGESAGFVEHLSRALQRPLDRLVRNADGAHASRQILARELARGRDRLAGKRLVVWQFAERELAHGDWKLIEWTVGDPSGRRFFAPPPGQQRLVQGTVQAVAPVPHPNKVPYRDHIVAVHLVDLKNVDGAAEEALVYMWGMRDRRWSRAARYRSGQQLTIRLRRWEEVADQYGGLNRGDLSGDDLLLAEPCWGEEAGE